MIPAHMQAPEVRAAQEAFEAYLAAHPGLPARGDDESRRLHDEWVRLTHEAKSRGA